VLVIGADVVVLDRSIDRLRELDDFFVGTVQTGYATGLEIECASPRLTWSSARCWSRAPRPRTWSAASSLR
jgi:hypothetical protein